MAHRPESAGRSPIGGMEGTNHSPVMSGFLLLAVMTTCVYTHENTGGDMSTPIRSIRLGEKHWEALKLLGTDWLKQTIDQAIKRQTRKPNAKRVEE